MTKPNHRHLKFEVRENGQGFASQLMGMASQLQSYEYQQQMMRLQEQQLQRHQQLPGGNP